MSGDRPAEEELLRAVARPQCDTALVASLAPKIGDFERLVKLAREHGVLPLLYARVAESGAAIPSEFMQRLDEEYCVNAVRSLAAISELTALVGDFEKSGIRALPFKGVALANFVYGKSGLRAPGDLDVLIARRDAAKAARVAMDRGYELHTPLRGDSSPAAERVFEYHLERPRDGMVLELRWRLTQWYLHADMGMDWAWPRREALELQGGKIAVMSAEDTLLLLCVHGSKHGWSRLIWVCDVAWLLAGHGRLDWQGVARDAQGFGLTKHLELGVGMAGAMLGVALPEGARQYLQQKPGMTELARHLDEHFFDAGERMAAGAVPFHLQLLGTRDRWRWAWRQQPWKPNEMDRAAVRLPGALGFLYYAVRPLRLARDSWRRRRG